MAQNRNGGASNAVALLKRASVLIASIIALPFLIVGFLKLRHRCNCSIGLIFLYSRLRTYGFLRGFPLSDLSHPDDFNQFINRYKFLRENKIPERVADKIEIKNYVFEVTGRELYPKTIIITNDIEQIKRSWSELPKKFVLKANHDSGSVLIVQNSSEGWAHINLERIASAQKRGFGWFFGEWCYSKIERKIFIEEMIESDSIADIKVHCFMGKAAWVQYIWNRSRGAKEAIFDVQGNNLAVSFDQNMDSISDIEAPVGFGEAITVSEQLSEPFQYARVDCYFEGGKLYVGEITFFPLAGFYRGDGQRELFRKYALPILS